MKNKIIFCSYSETSLNSISKEQDKKSKEWWIEDNTFLISASISASKFRAPPYPLLYISNQIILFSVFFIQLTQVNTKAS